MEESNQKKLTQLEMQEMLPDYVFNRLPAEDAVKFEYSLTYYPEFQKEVNEVRGVFDRLDATEFNNTIESGSKNLTVNLNRRLEGQKVNKYGSGYISKIVLPTLGLAAIVIYFFITGLPQNKNLSPIINESKVGKYEPMFVKLSDAIIILDSTSDTQDISGIISGLEVPVNEAIAMNIPQNHVDEIDELFNEVFADSFKSIDSKGLQTIFEYNGIQFQDLLKEFNYIDENDFQILLKALENEDFKS